MNSYPLGDPVRVSVAFANSSGSPADPSTITAKVRTPAGVITTNTYGDGFLLKDGTGAYHLDITTSSGGVWSYRFIGAGNLVAANETEFFVQYSDFGPTG